MDYANFSTDELFAALENQLYAEQYYSNRSSWDCLMENAVSDSRKRIDAIRAELLERGYSKSQLF